MDFVRRINYSLHTSSLRGKTERMHTVTVYYSIIFCQPGKRRLKTYVYNHFCGTNLELWIIIM